MNWIQDSNQSFDINPRCTFSGNWCKHCIVKNCSSYGGSCFINLT